jgi:hypothetical protein
VTVGQITSWWSETHPDTGRPGNAGKVFTGRAVRDDDPVWQALEPDFWQVAEGADGHAYGFLPGAWSGPGAGTEAMRAMPSMKVRWQDDALWAAGPWSAVPDGELWPADLAEKMALGLLPYVTGPLRKVMWSAFTDGMATAREMSPGWMPKEKTTEVAPRDAVRALGQMLATVTGPTDRARLTAELVQEAAGRLDAYRVASDTAARMVRCAGCGKRFTPVNASHKSCSPACRVRLSRMRSKQKIA